MKWIVYLLQKLLLKVQKEIDEGIDDTPYEEYQKIFSQLFNINDINFMKELSIEEKAKRYDEALKVLHKYDCANIMFSQSLKEELFPELKESEDERIRKALIKYYSFDKDGGSHALDNITPKQIVTWLEKQGEQKPTDEEMKALLRTEYEKGRADAIAEMQKSWSEEDISKIDRLIMYFKGKDNKEFTEWFSLLKDRVLPQPKQEWSEEEIEKAAQEWDSKANFNPFYMTMDGDKPTGVKQDITTHKESFKAGVNWILKFLKPQNTWKPSDEQMEALESATENCAYSEYQDCLRELIVNIDKDTDNEESIIGVRNNEEHYQEVLKRFKNLKK